MFARAVGRRVKVLARRMPVLGIRDFRLLLADRILAPASIAFSIIGVSFAVLNATHGSTAALSYVLAAQLAPSIVFVLLGGVIADRVAPQKVIVAANVMMALGEGTFGILVLAGHPQLWQMIALECLTGTGIAIFYPASTALLPRIVPSGSLQEASALSRLAMNGGQMGGAVLAGFCVAAIGPGWALTICGCGLLGTLPLMLSLRVTAHERVPGASLVRDLREGWTEFCSHTWIWTITLQFAVVMMAWYGAFEVLGPAVLRLHFGPHHGPAAWGAIMAALALGLILGGVASLRLAPRRPMVVIVLVGGSVALAPLALGMFWPLPLICIASFGLGISIEIMMVQWTVAMARQIPPGKLARVSSYDALGTMLATPLGAVLVGPIAQWISIPRTEFGAAGLIVVASLLALIPRDIRHLRADQLSAEAVTEAEPSALAEAS